jgi:hypothetical protein
LALLILAAALAACGPLARLSEPTGGPFPEACAQWSFSAQRCRAIVDRAVANSNAADADIRSISLLPFKRDPRLGGRQVALVRLELADGTAVDQGVSCVGIDMGLVCDEDAKISVYSGVDRDVPCAGEPPAGCATLPPTPDAEAIADSNPFREASLDVPLDHKGPYEIRLGTATLPNGYLSERAFKIADRRPDTFWIDDGIRLDVRPDLAGRPAIGSVYRDPFVGAEPATIFLVFEVTQLDSPSVLQVRDIVLR